MKIWHAVAAVILFNSTAASASDRVLVTAEEAARPEMSLAETRGIFPGPGIRLVAPSSGSLNSPLTSPIHLKVDFLPRNGATIDLTNTSVRYLKIPPVDVTSRLRGAIGPTGIDIDGLMLPAGRHVFQIAVTDSHGVQRSTTYTFVVGK